MRSPRLLTRGTPAGPSAAPEGTGAAEVPPGRETWPLSRVEEEHIRLVLARHRGNATLAARQLGISRTTLWRKLKQYGVRRVSG